MPPQIPEIPLIPGQEPDDFYELQRRFRNQRLFPIDPRFETRPAPKDQPITFSPTNQFELERRGIEAAYKMLENLPNRNDPKYKPSIWRKLGATAVGVGVGGKEGQAFMEGPYASDLADWQARWGPTKDIATLERYANAVNRQSINDKLDYAAQTTRANRRMFTNEEGRIMVLDLVTGQVIDTGESSNRYTDSQLTEMGIGRDLRNRTTESMRQFFLQSSLEEQRRAGRSQLEDQQARNREALQRQRDNAAMDRVKEREDRIGGVPLQQASQQKVAWMNNAIKLAEDPNYKDWIETNTQDGYPRVKDPDEMLGDWRYRLTNGRFGTGPTEAERREGERKWRYLMDNIFTGISPLRTPANTSPSNRVPTPNQGGIAGRVRVFDENGVERGTIDRDDIDGVLKANPGWSIK